MGCGVCGVDHALEACYLLGPYLPVNDTPTLSYARLSLPAGLEVKDLINGSKTVVATTTFLRGVQFGPFKAPISPILLPSITFPLKLYLKNGDIVFLKTDEEMYCNWMCLVDTATCEEEINMYCYQMNENIYFSVMKDILPGTELKVWYSPHYAKVMDIDPLLNDTFLVESPLPSETEMIGDHQYLNKLAKKRKKKFKKLKGEINCTLSESIKGKLPAEVLGAKMAVAESEWKCHTCNVIEPNVAAFARHLIHHIKIKLRPRCRYCNVKRNGKHEINCKLHLYKKGITDGSDLAEEYSNKTTHKTTEDVPNNVLSDATNSLNTDHAQLTDELMVKDTSALEKETDLLICDKDRDFVNYQFEIMDTSKSNLNLQVSDFCNKSMWNSDSIVPMDTSNNLVPLNDSSLSLKDRQLDLNPPILDLSDEIEFQSLKNFTDTIDTNRFIGKPFNMCRNVGCPDLFDNVAVSNLLNGVDNISTTTEQFPIFSLDKSEYQKFDNLLEVTDEDKNRLVENLLKETDDRINVFDVSGVSELKEDMNGELLVSNDKSKAESKKENVKARGSHSCEICDKCFTNLKYLVRHLRKHTGEFSCKFCMNIFARKETLLSHTCLTQTEEEPKRKRCGICLFVLHSGVELKNHIAKHYCTDSNWDCKHCRLVGEDVKVLDKHYCAESNGLERQFSCNNCNKVFSTSTEFTEHRQEINVKKIKVPKEIVNIRVCEICGVLVKNKALPIHMQAHFGKRFECKKCGMKFTRKDSMLHHESTHTSEKALSQNKAMVRAKRNFHKCEVCQKTFPTKARLTKHSAEHDRVQKIECSYCELKFITESSLKSHIRIKHMEHKTIYTCCYCNAKVTHRTSLKRHLINRHGKSKDELDEQGALDSMKSLVMNQSEVEKVDEGMQEDNFEASEQQNVQIVDKEVLLNLVNGAHNLPESNPEELDPLSKDRILELLNGTSDVTTLTGTENLVGLSKEGIVDIVNSSSDIPLTDPEGLIMLSKERLFDLINGISDVAALNSSQDLVGLNKQDLLDLVNGANVENILVNVLLLENNIENEPIIETEDMNPKTDSIVPMVQLSDSEEFVGMNVDITCITNGNNIKNKQSTKDKDMATKTDTIVPIIQQTDSEKFVDMIVDIPCITSGINVGNEPNAENDHMVNKTDAIMPIVQLTDPEEFVDMNVDITCINNGINTYILEDGRIVNEDVQLGRNIFLYVVQEPTTEDQELLFA